MPIPQPTSESERLRLALGEDFEILEELGRGGMAIVFRARDRALGRDVAIKTLPAHLMVDRALIERFEHEARTAGNLEHPNIIPIYRVGRAGVNGGVSYFVMKLLRGESLSDVLRRRGKLPPEELRTLLIETASALGYAAKHAVVHRDIKPDNILFDNEGRSVLTDFGIAKTPGGQHSAPGMVIGSPRYMSPEHALSLPLDGRSDIYSLGVVAYEALAGVAPFVGQNPLEIISRHIHEPPPTPPLRTAAERDLYRVIARMLAKKPAERFQTADEVIVALGGQLMPHTPAIEDAPTAPVPVLSTASTEPVITVAAHSDGIAAPAPGKRRFSWTSVAVVLLGVAGAAVLAVVIARSSPRRVATAPARKPDTAASTAPAEQPQPAPVTSQPAVVVTPPPETKIVPDTALPEKKVVAVTPPAPRPKPPRPKPSPRAAAILAYNRLASSCAKRDTMPDAKPIEYEALIDSVADRSRGDAMSVVYDVCGLQAGTPFIGTFSLTKLKQRGLGQQKPHVETVPGTATSPRFRQTRTLDIHEMSPGSYRLELVVTTGDKVTSTSREFRIADK